MKCVRKEGTASFRALNHVRVQRVSRTPLLGTPCTKKRHCQLSNIQFVFLLQLVEDSARVKSIYILHDHIVGGDAVGCDEEEGLLIDFIQITNLAPGNEGEGALQVSCCESRRHDCGVQLQRSKRNKRSMKEAKGRQMRHAFNFWRGRSGLGA